MSLNLKVLGSAVAVWLGCMAVSVHVQAQELPPALEPWKEWVLWDTPHLRCPTPYNTPSEHICVWPERLELKVDTTGGSWNVRVQVFEQTWVSLPGNSDAWPLNVRVDDEVLPVTEQEGVPAVQLPAGSYQITGEFLWPEMPQHVAVPKQIGIVSLVVNEEAVPVPDWDQGGRLWLKRRIVPTAAQDRLEVQVYRVIEDGIPLWLRTQVHLTVSGKSREKTLGHILPEGWQLSMIDSTLPVAVDDQGVMKAQIRAGNWTILLHAFRNTDFQTFQFPPQAQPVTPSELIGFRAQSEFRLAELEGLEVADASQTTFPEAWRNLPVYRWVTESSFRLLEKQRGIGAMPSQGLQIHRKLWLDDDGQGFTCRDRLSGPLHQTWRLDVTPEQELGAVRVDGVPQLLTANPETGACGVEIRRRDLQMVALARSPSAARLSATGWQVDADSLRVSLSLPPGWRVFALFGADQVDGDWLSAWTLLDLFLLLIFSLAVYRLWGLKAGIVAFCAYGLAYHEPGAPRLTWLFLLMPLALLRVVPEGRGQWWLTAWKYLAVGLLLLNFVPFVAQQIQSAIYPQLETAGIPYRSRGMFEWLGSAYDRSIYLADYAQEAPVGTRRASQLATVTKQQANLLFDPRSQIQTGPAEPEWDWNQVICRWSGHVSSDQHIRPILIPRGVQQGLTVLRVFLLLLLAAIVLGMSRIQWLTARRPTTTAVLLLGMCLPAGVAVGQIPEQQMLETLRQRLLKTSDAYPHAAELSTVHVQLRDGKATTTAKVHAAIDVAIPLPGKLPDWSPLSVSLDNDPHPLVCRRDDGYLWVNVPQGVHTIVAEGMLAETPEWNWTFLLTPRRVTFDAPDWEVTGVRPNGVPADHVLLTRREQLAPGATTYDNRNVRVSLAVERRLEMGLRWKVRSSVKRLSVPAKAISVQLPLLTGESVVSSQATVANNMIQINLGANQKEFHWDSELTRSSEITLQAPQSSAWIERWYLVASPVWHVAFGNLSPSYEADAEDLVPVWRPWPGESVELNFLRPEPAGGETLTIQRVHHSTQVNVRERFTKLDLQVDSSLGDELPVDLAAAADLRELRLQINGQQVPERLDGSQLLIPVQPGQQSISVTWKTVTPLTTVVTADAIKLPVQGSNVTTVIEMPSNRWTLWTQGPLRGPAVRFWTILIFAIVSACILAKVSLSPLRRREWVLLAIGLTQVHVAAALLVVGWLFLLAWRRHQAPEQLGFWRFNSLQILLVPLTLVVLGIFIVIVGEGLLGTPDMFIVGNQSSRTYLNWYQPVVGNDLPQPFTVSIPIWFYRILMLVWALWLATALLRWLQMGWTAFSHGGCWKPHQRRRRAMVEPPVPVVEAECVDD